MKEDLLKQLLESILGKSKSARGGDEAVFYCPSCNHHKKKLTFNQLMTIVDEIEKSKNKILTKCSKAKLEPILRAKNALENDFIHQIISRETSNKWQELYESSEKEIIKITEKKIKFLLGLKNYERYLKEKV